MPRHHNLQFPVLAPKIDVDLRSIGMAQRVCDRFLRSAKTNCLNLKIAAPRSSALPTLRNLRLTMFSRIEVRSRRSLTR
jgi:hypothetical protein